jgi:TP53 regulating kinase-like protein
MLSARMTEAETDVVLCQGAEGKVYSTFYLGRPAVCKVRLSKSYRVPALDEKINKQRLLQEARCIAKCKKFGISAPR